MPSQSMRAEYRLTWESIDPRWAYYFVAQKGSYQDLWDEGAWDTLPWQPPTVRIGGEDSGIHGQHNQLKRWAETHTEPIRNVVLERREIVVDDGGWEVVGG